MANPEESKGDASAGAGWRAEIDRLKIVAPERVRIWRDGFRHLHVQVDADEEYVDVKPVPVFPVSEAADYVSFLDGKDKEVLLLRDPGELDQESRAVLREELSRTYFVPRIVHIYQIEDTHGAARWEVETDRGYRVFDIRDREDVRVIRRSRVLLQDADGNRFEIEDIHALDERSQHLLETEI
ncbi:MAG: DUF1854 domain-containing protein [Armatimonadota bacterium]